MEKRELYCVLTDSEWCERARALADAHGEIDALERSLKETTSDIKARIVAMEARTALLSRVLQTRNELRFVDVEKRIDVARGEVSYVRLDTLEVLERRAVTDAEIQTQLVLGGDHE